MCSKKTKVETEWSGDVDRGLTKDCSSYVSIHRVKTEAGNIGRNVHRFRDT